MPHIRSTKSRFEVVRYSEKWFHLLLLKWLNENWSLFLIYKSCPVTYKSCQREHKINYYSWSLSRGKNRLIKWIYKARYELLSQLHPANHYAETVMLGPFQSWNFLWVPNSYFRQWKLLNTAVDSDVGYVGAELNSVCCEYSQSLFCLFVFFFHPIWIRVSIIHALYSAHVKCVSVSDSTLKLSNLVDSDVSSQRSYLSN